MLTIFSQEEAWACVIGPRRIVVLRQCGHMKLYKDYAYCNEPPLSTIGWSKKCTDSRYTL